jgi:hypothetical protein
MENNHKFKLIDGKFNATEAGKILLALLNSKINYHNLQAFSIRERYSGDVSHIDKRVEELKAVCEELREVLDYADNNNIKLKIDSTINIEMIQKA